MASLFVHQLCVIDSAILHPERGLVGISWIVDVTLDGELDDQGMLLDFGPAKQKIKRLIDDQVDHKLLLARDDPRLNWREQHGRLEVEHETDTGSICRLRCPPQAVCVLPLTDTGAACVSEYLQGRLLSSLPDNISAIRIRMYEEPIEDAAYAYCHGLKRHGGNCQRIAHGHRSRIRIFVDGERSPPHEQRWAQRCRDSYIGNREDLADATQPGNLRFCYSADQGDFDIELDANRCVLLNADSTVENIAAHIARQLKDEQPQHSFEVHAYEGFNKGAVANN